MTQAGDKPARQPVLHTAEEREQIERFVKAINQAMVVNGLSQRGLCERIGVKVGTLTKYLRGEVAPMKVGIGIQAALAGVLGVTVDALLGYYRNEEYLTAVSLEQVESWIRSDAGQEDLPTLMASLQVAGQRWISGEPTEKQQEAVDVLQPWKWPLRELEEAEVSERFRERLGLTEERMVALVERGEYDEDLIEAFSVACNYEMDAVREAFEKRQPIA
jgi:transcriptional regulator with XRE-family HTH domain